MNHRKKTLAEAGELDFIRRIRPLMPDEGGDIVRSVGDDCFAARSFGNDLMTVTTDTFVDGVHFSRDFSSWRNIGARCMAASVSDIAAMAGLPRYSTLSFSMPPGMLLDHAVELFKGFAETGERYGAPVVGGETTSTPGPLTMTVTVIGRVEPDRMTTRAGAKPGDSLYVTGWLGDAMAGLLALQTGVRGFESLKSRFIRPEAKVAFGRELTGRFDVSAMIDLSDGLASDLGHICEESGCGAEVRAEALPFSEEFRELMSRHGKNPVQFAITAGEDYGLLFTSGDPELERASSVPGETVSRIGTITGRSGEILLICGDGSAESIRSKGYEHFKSG